jgi:hypothetical protein
MESGRVPVCRTNIAAGVTGNAATVDDYAENHEAHAGRDLHNTEDELHLFPLARLAESFRGTRLAITLHAKDLDDHQGAEQRDDPGTVVDARGSVPIVDDVARGGDLERKDRQPADRILPPARETPRGVDEAADVHGEGAVDGVHDGHLGESLHHEVATRPH